MGNSGIPAVKLQMIWKKNTFLVHLNKLSELLTYLLLDLLKKRQHIMFNSKFAVFVEMKTVKLLQKGWIKSIMGKLRTFNVNLLWKNVAVIPL